MSKRSGARPVSDVLFGAVKWSPILMIPFAAFFSETWLQLGIYRADYEANDLQQKIKDVSLRLESLKEQSDELAALDELAAKAPDMGLVQPQPSQIEVVYQTPSESRYQPPYTVASLSENAADAPPLRPDLSR